MSFIDDLTKASDAYYQYIIKLATDESSVEMDSPIEKLAKSKWRKMPKGWESKSRKDFFKHLADSTVTKCMEKMEDKISDPGAFCASLKDRVSGKTDWRKGKKKKKKK